MKTETLADYRKRDGTIKTLKPRKARGLKTNNNLTSRHMSTKKQSHVWWKEENEKSN